MDSVMSLFGFGNSNPALEIPAVPLYTTHSNSVCDTIVDSCTPVAVPSFLTSYLDIAPTYAVPNVMIYSLLFTLVIGVWECFLKLRQLSCYKIKTIPETLLNVIADVEKDRAEEAAKVKKEGNGGEDDGEKSNMADNSNFANSSTVGDNNLVIQTKEKFDKAQSYGLDKMRFDIFQSIFSLVLEFVCVVWGYLPFLWDHAAALVERWSSSRVISWFDDKEIVVTAAFFVIYSIVELIQGLPFGIYGTFFVEAKHGFNNTTAKVYAADKVKGFILSVLIGSPVVMVVVKIVKWGGDSAYLYLWAFFVVFQVVMMTVVPEYIMPLFNKYMVLPDGELKTEIHALANELNYPLKKLYEVDGSKRSSHSNAYMYGFWKNKRVVLYDTLIKQLKINEILSVLGHEFGHWAMSHSLQNFVITNVYFGALFYLYGLVLDSSGVVYASFGFGDGSEGGEVPTLISLILFSGTLWAPVDKIVSLLMTYKTRMCEFQADEFSVKLGRGKGLKTGLVKISLENLGAMAPDWLYSAYYYSHPPVVERIGAIIENMAKHEKKKV